MCINYEVNNFVCYSIEEETIVHSEDAIVRIENKMMQDFIFSIETMKSISDDKIKMYFGEELFEAALNFMISNNIIKELPKVNFEIERLIVVSNCKKLREEMERYLYIDIKEKIKWLTVDINQFLVEDLKDNDFIILLLNPYTTMQVKEIYKKINGMNIYLLSGYFYYFNFYFDNLYNPFWHNPDHFDHVGYISEKTYAENNCMAYQDLIDLLYYASDYEEKSVPISYKNQLHIIRQTIILVEKLIRLNNSVLYPHEMLEVYKIELDIGELTKDSAIFWEMRDIYD